MLRSTGLNIKDKVGKARPHDSASFPILAVLGYNNWPEADSFEDLPVEVQIAWSAQKGTTEWNEQNIDWTIISQQNSGLGGYPNNIWETQAIVNSQFIAYWVQGPGGNTALVQQSWTYYTNWLLGIDDSASYPPWDGTRNDFKGYKAWYAQERKLSVTAVPHTGW